MRKISREDAHKELLELFYPIHYSVCLTVEDSLRSSILTRQQTVLLWFLRSKGIDGKKMSRKEIVKWMSYWFDTTGSAISKSLRSLSRPPLSLIKLTEDPHSGREKQIELTAKGEKFLLEMMENGREICKILTDGMTESEYNHGLHFLARCSEIFETEVEQKRDLPESTIGRPSVSMKS